jgi:hypothetical protein
MVAMYKVKKTKRFWTFTAYFALVGGIIAAGAVFGLYTRSKRVQAPNSSLPALRSATGQVILAAQSLQSIDGTSDTSPQFIASLVSSQSTSLQSAKDILKKQSKKLSPEVTSQLSAVLTGQQQLLDELGGRYKILGKAISYNPSLDLGNLDPVNNADTLQQRAQAAHDNLNKLAQTPSFSFKSEKGSINTSGNYVPTDATYDVLAKAASCFGQLSEAVKTKNTAQINETRSQCIRNYPAIRKQLVTELTTVYTSQKAQDSLTLLSNTVKKLP